MKSLVYFTSGRPTTVILKYSTLCRFLKKRLAGHQHSMNRCKSMLFATLVIDADGSERMLGCNHVPVGQWCVFVKSRLQNQLTLSLLEIGRRISMKIQHSQVRTAMKIPILSVFQNMFNHMLLERNYMLRYLASLLETCLTGESMVVTVALSWVSLKIDQKWVNFER